MTHSSRGPGTESDGPIARYTEDLFRALVAAAPDGIVIVDREGCIVVVNPAMATMLGYRADELLGQPLALLVPERLRAIHAAHHFRFRNAPVSRSMGGTTPLVARRSDGAEVAVEISLSPLEIDGAHLTIAQVRDVSERLESERAAREAEERWLIVEERERIARDLHDVVIQRLFGAGMQLQGAAARTPDDATRGRLLEVIDQLDGTIRDVRTAVFRLHQRTTDRGGLRDRIVAIAEEAARPLGVEPHIRFDGLLDTSVSDAIAEDAVAITREALANCARHAQASRVDIDLTIVDGTLRVCVVDDGNGVPEQVGSAGNGLRNIRTRAEQHGGCAAIRRGEHGGTTVTWEVPLSPV